jgi:hypothetical protein
MAPLHRSRTAQGACGVLLPLQRVGEDRHFIGAGTAVLQPQPAVSHGGRQLILVSPVNGSGRIRQLKAHGRINLLRRDCSQLPWRNVVQQAPASESCRRVIDSRLSTVDCRLMRRDLCVPLLWCS